MCLGIDVISMKYIHFSSVILGILLLLESYMLPIHARVVFFFLYKSPSSIQSNEEVWKYIYFTQYNIFISQGRHTIYSST
jgi:hypothetical protein